MNLQRTADNLNLIADFLGKRDVNSLTASELLKKFGVDKVDLLVLFGGSIAHGCDVAGKAIGDKVAENIMIVGGEGHTTDSLRKVIHSACPDIITKGRCEAEIMNDYLKLRYGIKNAILECESTNCGNNVTNTLDLIRQKSLDHSHMLIIQDASMQLRMDAGFKKYIDESHMNIINFASYKAEVIVHNNELNIKQDHIRGMWPLDRYITLLMGEIPRLRDDIHGYGPQGKNFIAHVDIPHEVLLAYDELKPAYESSIRAAVQDK